MNLISAFKKLEQIKTKFQQANAIKNRVIIISEKIDVIYDDVFNKINFDSTLQILNTTLQTPDLNTLNIENVITTKSVSKIEYYKSVLSKFKGDDTRKQEMKSKIESLENTLQSNKDLFKDETKKNAINKLLTLDYEELDNKVKIFNKESIISENKPVVHNKDMLLSGRGTMDIKIFSHPCIEWSNWIIQDDDEEKYFLIDECIWFKKGKTQTINFKQKFQEPGLIHKEYYDINEITLCINSVDPNHKIKLKTQSTDNEPFKVYLETEIVIPSMSIDTIELED